MDETALRSTFATLMAENEEATQWSSSWEDAAAHRSFSKLLDLGEDIIPLLMERLHTERSGGLEFMLLSELTRQDPTHGITTVAGARMAWLTWYQLSLPNA
jgi:hypothetical protein